MPISFYNSSSLQRTGSGREFKREFETGKKWQRVISGKQCICKQNHFLSFWFKVQTTPQCTGVRTEGAALPSEASSAVKAEGWPGRHSGRASETAAALRRQVAEADRQVTQSGHAVLSGEVAGSAGSESWGAVSGRRKGFRTGVWRGAPWRCVTPTESCTLNGWIPCKSDLKKAVRVRVSR